MDMCPSRSQLEHCLGGGHSGALACRADKMQLKLSPSKKEAWKQGAGGRGPEASRSLQFQELAGRGRCSRNYPSSSES